MKWLGQHVFNFVSYFNDEVFYDGVPDGTIEPDFNLGLDANNRLVKAAVGTNTSSSVFKWYFRDDGDVSRGMSHGKVFKVFGLNGVTVDWVGGAGTSGDPYDLAINAIGASVSDAASLTTARSINGVGFNGTADITIPSNLTTVIGTLTPANGGTGLTSFADKSVLITQDSGPSALSALPMNTNGLLMIGGPSGPVANTLTQGSNVTITNTDGGITIAAANDVNTYVNSWVDDGDDAKLRLTKNGSVDQDLNIVAGSNITITPSGSNLTIAATSTISSGGSIDSLSDVDTSTDTPDVNQVLKWNGQDWVPAGVNESFAFAWNSVVYTPSYTDVSPTNQTSGSSYVSYASVLIGSGNHSTSAAITHNFSNAVSNKFTSGANGSDNLGLQTKQYGEGDYTARANLNFSNNTASASHTINYPYPTDLSGGRYAYIKSQFDYDGTAYSIFVRYSYLNYAYLGKHTDDSPTNNELQNFQKKQYISSGSNASGSIAQSITLNSTSQHLQLWIPDRITDDPTFEVGPNANSLLPETWTKILNGDGTTFILDHENSSGFSEDYRGYKSPNPLNNSSLSTWYVKATY